MVNAGLSVTWKPAAFHPDFLRRPQPFRPAPLTTLRARHSQPSPACHGRMERSNQSQLKAPPQNPIASRSRERDIAAPGIQLGWLKPFALRTMRRLMRIRYLSAICRWKSIDPERTAKALKLTTGAIHNSSATEAAIRFTRSCATPARSRQLSYN